MCVFLFYFKSLGQKSAVGKEGRALISPIISLGIVTMQIFFLFLNNCLLNCTI